MRGLFPCHKPLGLLLEKVEHGIFDVRLNLSACCAHEGETDTDGSVQMLNLKNDPSPCLHRESTAKRAKPLSFDSFCCTYNRSLLYT